MKKIIGKILCKIGWHEFTCKMQDYIDEFGYVPLDSRMPKVAKCSKCGKSLNKAECGNKSKPLLATGFVEERKTIFDYYNIFRIQYGARYHAYDYACQVCNKSFKLYEEAKTDKEREMNWEIAKIIASKLNAPIPIVLTERER